MRSSCLTCAPNKHRATFRKCVRSTRRDVRPESDRSESIKNRFLTLDEKFKKGGLKRRRNTSLAPCSPIARSICLDFYFASHFFQSCPSGRIPREARDQYDLELFHVLFVFSYYSEVLTGPLFPNLRELAIECKSAFRLTLMFRIEPKILLNLKNKTKRSNPLGRQISKKHRTSY